MEVDPSDGTLRFTFQTGRRKEDIDDTIERLLELLGELAAERKRRVVIIFDEFQEILALDTRFPNLMRAVFQAQPEVSHVYLGSKQHLLSRIFNDKNEPFWRSAKQLEIGMIPPAEFAAFIRKRFADSGKGIAGDALERLLAATGGHPYGTQELAYFTWELVPSGNDASRGDVEEALSRVLRSEHNHFTSSGTTRRIHNVSSCSPWPTSRPLGSTPPPTTRATSYPPPRRSRRHSRHSRGRSSWVERRG